MELDNAVGLLQASPRQWSCHVYYKPAPDNGPAVFLYKKSHILWKERACIFPVGWRAENDEVIQYVFL
jgi:hypothetical protein